MQQKNLGTVVLELPPKLDQDNPRNSEGSFITLDDGTIIFVYSRFKGKSNADSATADLALLYSHDGGRSFSDEYIALTCEGENGVNMMSPSFLRMQNGDIGLFYLVRTTYTLMQMFMRRSADGGKTWSERVLCTPEDGYFVVNNDRVRRLANGRIIIPAASHRAGQKNAAADDSKDNSKDIYIDGCSETLFFYSDDDGQTWQRAQDKCYLPDTTYSGSGLQEPGVIELKPDILYAWARTDLGRQYEMYSFDNGEHWTTAQLSRFTSPNSPLSIRRMNNQNLLAVWNPIPNYNGRDVDKVAFTGGRSPLVYAISKDNGKSYSEPFAFEFDEKSGYCYCAIHFTEDAVLLAYCAGSEADGGCLVRTRIRRIPLEELESNLEASD